MSAQVKYTLEEWRAKGTALFGEDFMKWKFVCPVCGHVAAVQDWKDAGASAKAAAFSCVGRWAGANPATTKGDIGPNGIHGKGPCNYGGGGLFQLNPVVVVDLDGVEIRAFDFDCVPVEACATHGRCWAHSEWQRCGSLIRSVSSDPCEAVVDGLDGLCSGCREFKTMCEQHDETVDGTDGTTTTREDGR